MLVFLIVLAWYLVGAVGGLIISRKIIPETNMRDIFFFFTLGGIAGIFTVFIGLTHIQAGKFWTKKLF